jgi:hypothetical protein
METQQAEAPQIKTSNPKSKIVPIILAVFVGLLVIVELQQPNFGFSIELGRDIWALLIYVLGGKLIYDAFKLFKK